MTGESTTDLRMKEIYYKCVDYYDLEEFVNRIYGNGKDKYEFQVVEECGSDTFHGFRIDGVVEIHNSKKESEIRSGKFPSLSNKLILNLLCKDGYIRKGNYLIRLSY